MAVSRGRTLRSFLSVILTITMMMPPQAFSANELTPPVAPPPTNNTTPLENPEGAPANILAAAAASGGYDEFSAANISMIEGYGDQGDQFNPFTGEVTVRHVDLEVPGNGGLALKVTRVYRSQSKNTKDTYGKKWSMNYGRVGGGSGSCPDGNSENVIFESPEGALQKLFGTTETQNANFLSRDRYRGKCEGSRFVVYTPEGLRYQMGSRRSDGFMYTDKIFDSNGNYLNIGYTTNERVNSVDASDGRSVSFTYGDSGRLASMSFNGNGTLGVWKYSYSASGDLIGKTDPTNFKTTYSTGEVSSPAGYFFETKTPGGTSIRYNFTNIVGIGLAAVSRKVTGGNVPTADWTYTYSFTGADICRLTTLAKGPTRTISYKFDCGKNGEAYLSGLLLEKKILDGTTTKEMTAYTWGNQVLSPRSMSTDSPSATGVRRITDDNTRSPILTRVAVTRYFPNNKTSVYTTDYSNFDKYGNAHKVDFAGEGTGSSKTVTRSYREDVNNWLIRQPLVDTIVGAGTISRDYDAKGNLTSMSKFGVTTSYTYTAEGDIATETAADGVVTQYSGYKRGKPTQVVYAVDKTETATEGSVINGFGLATSSTNRLGKVTTYEYDAVGRLTKINYPGANTSKVISHTATSKTTKRTPTKGGAYTEVITYDGIGRVKSSTEGGITLTRTYDADGRLKKTSYPGLTAGDTTTYDVLDRPLKISHPDGKYTQFTYSEGNLVTGTDQDGKVTKNWYRSVTNPAEQILLKTENSIFTTELTRDVLGNIIKIEQYPTGVKDPIKVTRTYTFSAKKFLTKRNDPEVGDTVLTVDNMGRVTKEKRGSSAAVEFSYDAFGRMTKRKYTEDTTTFTYDANGNLLTVKNANATRSFAYDDLDRLISETLDIVGAGKLTQTIDRDTLGNIISTTSPGGSVDTFSSDSIGRPTKAMPFVSSITYTASSLPLLMTYANTKTSSHAYDSRMRLSALNTSGVSNISLTYDGRSNILSIVDSASTPDSGRRNMVMTYDNSNRMVTNNGDWGTGKVGYDAYDNITSINFGSARTITYSTLNRPDSITGSPDVLNSSRGNLSRVDGRTNYFDGNDRLQRVAIGTNNIDYKYDGLGNLISRKEGTATTYFFFNSTKRLMGQYDSSLKVKFEYVYLGFKLVGVRAASTKLSTHTDPRNAVLAVTAGDAVGTTLARASYKPFGEPINTYNNVQTLIGNVGFQGLFQDPKTGYILAGSRWLHPGIGRFLSMDPVQYVETQQHSFNRYAYGNNSPVVYWDPTGHFAMLIPLIPPAAIFLFRVTGLAMALGMVTWTQTMQDNPEPPADYVYYVAKDFEESQSVRLGIPIDAPGDDESILNHFEGGANTAYLTVTRDYATGRRMAGYARGLGLADGSMGHYDLNIVRRSSHVIDTFDIIASITSSPEYAKNPDYYESMLNEIARGQTALVNTLQSDAWRGSSNTNFGSWLSSFLD